MQDRNNESPTLAGPPVGDKSEPRVAGEQSASEVVFRTVTHAGKRKAFKLEMIFWRVLRFAASVQKRPFGEYVFSIIGTEDNNKTASLRVHAIEWMSQQLIKARTQTIDPSVLKSIVGLSQAPSLLVDERLQVVEHNQCLIDLLRARRDDIDREENTPIRLTLSKPVKTISESLLNSGAPFAEDTLSITCGTDRSHHKVRVCRVAASNGNLLGLLIVFSDPLLGQPR